MHCNTLLILREWFKKNKVYKVVNWPPNSTDLNLIKYLWDVQDQTDKSESRLRLGTRYRCDFLLWITLFISQLKETSFSYITDLFSICFKIHKNCV